MAEGLLKLNIFTLAEVCMNFTPNEYQVFLNLYGIEIKREETRDLIALVGKIDALTVNKKVFDDFYVGYKIPQIGKEFDLVRLSAESAVNIELKKKSSPENIHKQLVRNRYYMSHLGCPMSFYTFESESSRLYKLGADNELLIVEISDLVAELELQVNFASGHLDDYFDPTIYLVSPFNSTDRFLSGNYFLTNQQEQIQKEFLSRVRNNIISKFLVLSGSPGTGKTLLLYDLAKKLSTDYRVIIVHCANLNPGQNVLNEKGWSIYPIKDFSRRVKDLINECDFLFIDEAQRLKKDQLNQIVKNVNLTNKTCIFSYDQRQTLSRWEKHVNIGQYLEKIKKTNKFVLKKKIRTNKSIANFIMKFFDLQYKGKHIDKLKNIEVLYFSSHQKAKEYVESILEPDWVVLDMTKSLYTKDAHDDTYRNDLKCSHEVIGQEYDQVAVIIDEHFVYSGSALIYQGSSYYDAVRMLFQNMTRTRKKLMLIFVNNKTVFNEALRIANSSA